MTTPHDSPRTGNDEQFEHIPWEHLSAGNSNRRWWIYAGAGALVVAAVTASMVRNVAAVPTNAATEAVAAPDTMPSVPTTGAVITASTTVLPYSEADLMAFAPESLMAEAAAMAEWIASDFFTVDGSGAIPNALAGVLPANSALPNAAAGHRSYVEWSRAVRVEEVVAGQFRVLVVVRALGANDGEDYRRLQPKAVWLTMQWSPEGWSLLDLPAAGDAPPMIQIPAWPDGDLPVAIEETASAAGVVLSGGPIGEFWRVVVEVTDESGGAWPVVYWFDAAGSKIEEPQIAQAK